MSDRLYGLPGDEWMEHDPAGVYERWECNNDTEDSECRVPFLIEEWAAVGLGQILRADCAGRVLEWLGDDLYESEVSEGAADAIAAAVVDPEVVAAFEAAVQVLRQRLNRTGWLQADTKVQDMAVTWDADGKPLLDGNPMYVPSAVRDDEDQS